ncbi:uncharacterized protein LOC132703599 [Cylas formicarius]|uniref:uncharacterized protein LOC132703599 n=1 Tax=Cylas formicarius TaxID=197179 RepID=UPI002958C5CD|nr:uncharacterized protein LOC132703599 [Cylas formicarius]
MDFSVENVLTYFFIIIVCLLFVTLILNLHFILRNGFYVCVNCWFCNENSRVLYSLRNSFDCPICLQYNGFNKEGDYNKIIEAQRDSSRNTSNTSKTITAENRITSCNGLCNNCNNNLNLKVIQLASYEPLNQNNYDVEIDHFRKQLEKTYKLCRRCRKTVDSTIRRQNASLFANRIRERRKVHNLTQDNTQEAKPTAYLIFLKGFLIVLSILCLIQIGDLNTNFWQYFRKIVFENQIISTTTYESLLNTNLLKLYDWQLTGRDLLQMLKIKGTAILPLVGFTIEIITTFLELDKKNTAILKFSKLLGWIILSISFMRKFNKDILSYVNTLQIFCSLWLIYNNAISESEPMKNLSKKKYEFKKLSSTYNSEEYSDEEGDYSEPLGVTGTSNSFGSSKISTNTANKDLSFSRLYKTGSLLNIAPTQDLSSNRNHTALNTDLDKHFNGLNLGAFKSYDHRVPSPNPFMVSHRSFSPNSVFSFGRFEGTRSPNKVLHQQEHFSNSLFPSSLSPNLSLAVGPQFTEQNRFGSKAPLSINGFNLSNDGTRHHYFQNISSTQTSYPNYFQNNFTPVYRAETCDYPVNSPKINPLSAPKLNLFKTCCYKLKDNEQLNFSTATGFSTRLTESESVFSVPSNSVPVIASNLGIFVNDKTVNGSSRSSSRSSGFVSGNEYIANNVSLPNSRNHSPERHSQVPYHLDS